MAGTTTVGATSTGSETEGKTYATIGIDGLNRDIINNQEMGETVATGALDGSMTIDNRWLSENGRENILNDFAKLGENLEHAKDGLRDNIVSQTIYNGLTNDNVSAMEITRGAIL